MFKKGTTLNATELKLFSIFEAIVRDALIRGELAMRVDVTRADFGKTPNKLYWTVSGLMTIGDKPLRFNLMVDGSWLEHSDDGIATSFHVRCEDEEGSEVWLRRISWRKTANGFGYEASPYNYAHKFCELIQK